MKPYLAYACNYLRIRMDGRPHPRTQTLIVKGHAGLCNRLWYLLSAKAFTERWGLQVGVDWRDGTYDAAGVNAFPKLFTLDDAVDAPDDQESGQTFPTYWSGSESASFDHQLWSLAQQRKQRVAPKEAMYELHRLLVDRPPAEMVFCTGYRFDHRDMRIAGASRDLRILARGLQPSPECLRLLDDQLPDLQRCTGVHVRRTDAPNQVPLDRYFRLIPPAGDIFLCTDDPSVESEFRAKFGTRMKVVQRSYPPAGQRMHDPRHDLGFIRQMAIEAVRDLYGLARCRRIVQAGNSSFSRFAVDVLASPDCHVKLARPVGHLFRRLRRVAS